MAVAAPYTAEANITSVAELRGKDIATSDAIGLRTKEFDPTILIPSIRSQTGFISRTFRSHSSRRLFGMAVLYSEKSKKIE
ncbi:hypothetical protein [Ruegeria sp. R13_0]|uniref:hypothetical protein n=1 Tax=Ruegeria sp. R13_0 TaxID=2821099 RepID=UPI001FFE283A|nr:hypothetical protein [Ruegeria sp. R13_0]